MIWTLEIPGWVPTPLNKLLGHWGSRAKAKKKDRDAVGRAVMAYGCSNGYKQESKRRIDLLVIWAKGKRSTDPDSLWKSLCDSLVSAGAIFDDSASWIELGRVRYAKSPDDYCATIITITEI